jgi:CheY-like chemotaxis protein
MPGIGGLNVLQVIRERWPSCRTMLMTGSSEIKDERFEAIKLGALDFLEKPLDAKYLEHRFAAIRADLARHQSIADLELKIAERSSFEGLVGRSAAMRELFDLIRRMAPYARVSLITGETGVGKELVAHAMHQCGRRAGRPFVAINCAAVAETIVESELFGHVRGAFTGAVETKPGLIERADGGTLFLDEVGELSLAMQAKFLRVLESGELYRVGSVARGRHDPRRDQSRPGGGGARGPFQARSVFPAERRRTPCARLAESPGRHPDAGGPVHPGVRRADAQVADRFVARGRAPPDRCGLARQRAAVAKRDRACGHAGAGLNYRGA